VGREVAFDVRHAVPTRHAVGEEACARLADLPARALGDVDLGIAESSTQLADADLVARSEEAVLGVHARVSRDETVTARAESATGAGRGFLSG
jgi:hypothetical protein